MSLSEIFNPIVMAHFKGRYGGGASGVDYTNEWVTEIFDEMYYNFAGFASVNFPKATLIGSGSFDGCTNLKRANFPVATSTSVSAFRNCNSLEMADFSALTSIGRQTFYGCESLTKLILRGQTVCSFGSLSITNTPIVNGTGFIYVPSALVDTYKATSGWSYHAAQFRALEDYTVDGTITGALDEGKI